MTTDTQDEETITVDEIPDGPSVKDVINETTPDGTTKVTSVLSRLDRFTSNLVSLGALMAMTGLMGAAAGWIMLKGYVFALGISTFAATAFIAVPIAFAVLCGVSFVVQVALQKRGVTLV